MEPNHLSSSSSSSQTPANTSSKYTLRLNCKMKKSCSGGNPTACIACHHPQYKPDLILARRDFNIGETIPFQLKLEYPGCKQAKMSLSLVQNMFYSTKVNEMTTSVNRNRGENVMKYRQIVLAVSTDIVSTCEGLYPCRVNMTGTLDIPEGIPPTIKSEEINFGTDQISAIQYTLKVVLNQGEFVQIREDFPIEIRPRCLPKPKTNVVHTKSDQCGHCQSDCGRGLHESSSSSRLRQNSTSSVPDCSAGCSTSLSGLSGPPRYSMLSLPIKPFRSNSVETLPPNYEDTVDRK